MRNLKRVLSLALALVMVLGMMVITTSAATYTDAAEIEYKEAVDVMTGIGLYEGNPDGSLAPKQVLTRAMAATILARIKLGAKAEVLKATQQIFTDVPVKEWYAPAVQYCYNTGLIAGNGNGTFDPEGELTGIAFAKLLLVAMGYDADEQGYVGKDWASNIAIDALNNNLYIAGVDIAAELTREQAAQMILQALNGEMVEYVNSFDKATGAAILVGPNTTGETFGSYYFGGLTQVYGVISEVDLYYGNTTFYVGNGQSIEVRDCGADFNTVGYAAYTWAVPAGSEGSYHWAGLTDVYVVGTSMGVNTNGAGYSSLTNKYSPAYIGQIDTKDCSVYYNGEFVGAYDSKDGKDKLALADKVGVKVDFVDNDWQGKAEAIVITEYTFAQVTGIKKVSDSGEVSIKHYELSNGVKIAPSDLYYVDELSVGDFITYVPYGWYKNAPDFYLVTVLDVAEGEFESITRSKLNTETVKLYTIAGKDYIKSELSDAANTEYLKTSNINEDVVYVLDQYGYIVYAVAPAADPDSYVFVLDNEDSHGIKNLAETELAFIDGTVEIVDTAWKGDIEDGELADAIYTYTEKNGIYTLKVADFDEASGVDYETKTRKMAGESLTLGTIVVDLRDYLAGDADEGTVYVGYREIPSFVDGTIYYLTGRGGIALAFLVDGEDPSAIANLSASFVVFNTETNVVDKVKGVYTYELKAGVLIEGEVVYDYVLTQAQKDAIDALGVGVYTFAKDGSLASYTSFTEDSVEWTPEDNGVLFKGDKEITDDYTAIFLNIEDGEVNEWYEDVDAGEYFAWFDKKNDLVYVVADASIDEYNFKSNNKADVVTVFNGVAYYVADGYLTNKTADTKEDVLAAGYENVIIVVEGDLYEVTDEDVELPTYELTYTVEADTDALDVEFAFEVEAEVEAATTQIEVGYVASAAIKVTYEVDGEKETVELAAGEGTFVVEVAAVEDDVEIVIVKIVKA